jgi:hypothetical protein
MSNKLLSALLISAALVAPGVALAAQEDRCQSGIHPTELDNSPGDENRSINEAIGSPGQVQHRLNVPASVYVNNRNIYRKNTCPPPG